MEVWVHASTINIWIKFDYTTVHFVQLLSRLILVWSFSNCTLRSFFFTLGFFFLDSLDLRKGDGKKIPVKNWHPSKHKRRKEAKNWKKNSWIQQNIRMAAATSVVVLDRGNNTTCTVNLHGKNYLSIHVPFKNSQFRSLNVVLSCIWMSTLVLTNFFQFTENQWLCGMMNNYHSTQ